MSLDSGLLWAFLLVFVRCSATLLSSPFFGAQSTPIQIRVMLTLAISAALVALLRPATLALPPSLYEMAIAIANEAACGLLLGAFISLAMMAVQFAGSFLDLNVGLGMSQVMNPVTGVSSSVIAQFKGMLGIVIFLGLQGHHFVLEAFVRSYQAMPSLGLASLEPVRAGLVGLVADMAMLGLQIAAPVAAVGVIVDLAMGVVNRAVPQMPVFLVGLPVKIIATMVAMSVALPALVFGVQNGVERSTEALYRFWSATRSSSGSPPSPVRFEGRPQ